MNNINSFVDIIQHEKNRLNSEKKHIDEKSCLSTQSQINSPGNLQKPHFSCKKLFENKRCEVSFDHLATVAGNGFCVSQSLSKVNLPQYLSGCFNDLTPDFFAKFKFSNEIQSKIGKFTSELDALNKIDDFQSKGTVLIPVVKEGLVGKETFFIRIEKGVGVQVFDANVNFNEHTLKQGFNPINNDIQYDINTPSQLFFKAPKKVFDDDFFKVLLEGIKQDDISKDRLLALIENLVNAAPEVRNLGEATEKKGMRSPSSSEMKSLSFVFQSLLIGKKPQEGIRAYKIMMFYLEFQTFVSAWKNSQGQLRKEELMLFEDVLANLARKAEKLHMKKFFTDEDLEEPLATLRDIEVQLKSELQASMDVKQTDAIPFKPQKFDVSIQDLPMLLQPQDQVVKAAFQAQKMTPFSVLVPETAAKQLELLSKENLGMSLKDFEQFCKNFPTDESFWSRIPEKDIDGVIRLLQTIVTKVPFNFVYTKLKHSFWGNNTVTVDPRYDFFSAVSLLEGQKKLIELRKQRVSYFSELSDVNPKNVLSRLLKIQDILEETKDNHLFKTQFYLFMQTFPTPTNDDKSFWKGLPKTDVIGTMQVLTELMNQLVLMNRDLGSMSPEVLLMHHQFLAVIDQLARRSEEADLTNDHQIYIRRFLKAIRSNNFYLEAPFQEKLKEVVSYFVKDESVELYSLFREREQLKWIEKGDEAREKALFGFFGKEECKFGNKELGKDITLKYYQKKLEKADSTLKARVLKEVKAEKTEREQRKLDWLSNDRDTQLRMIQSATLYYTSRSPSIIKGCQAKIKQIDAKIIEHKQNIEKIKSLTFEELTNLEKVAGLMVRGEEHLPKAFSLLQEAAVRASHYCIDNRSSLSSMNFMLVDYSFEEPRCDTVRFTKKMTTYNREESSSLAVIGEAAIIERDLHFQNYQIAKPFSPSYNLSQEAIQELIQVSDDFYDEVNRLVAFCRNNRGALTDYEIQKIIKAKFLRVDRLKLQLKVPGFEKCLTDFIKDSILYAQNTQKQDLCCFFVELGTIVAPFLDDKTTFVKEVREKALTIASNMEPNDGRKVNILDIVLKFYPEVTPYSLSEKQPPNEFLIDFILRSLFESETKRPSQETNGIRFFARPYLLDFIEKNEVLRNTILNEVIAKKTGASVSNERWESVKDGYQSRQFTLDLSTNTLQKIGATKEKALPVVITETDLYKRVIGNKVIFSITELTDGWFEVDTDEGLFKFFKQNSNLYVRKKIDQNWCSLQPQVSDICDSYASVLKRDFFFWRMPDGSFNVYDGNTHAFTIKTYRDKVEEILDKRTSEKIVNPKSYQVDGLKCFEKDTAYIECREKGNDFTIELPRVNLGFERRGGRLYSKQYTEFYVINNVPLEGFPEAKICLENHLGERKFLFPNPRVLGDETFFTLSLQNGELKAPDNSVSSQLFLASVYFQAGKFKEGQKALKKVKSFKLFTPKEIAYIKQLIESASQIAFVHPLGALCALQLIIKVEVNALKNSPLVETDNIEDRSSNGHTTTDQLISGRELGILYLLYLKNRGNMGGDHLSIEEEKLFMEYWGRRFPKDLPIIAPPLNALQVFFPKVFQWLSPILLAPIVDPKKDFFDGKKVAVRKAKVSLVDIKAISLSKKTINNEVLDDMMGKYETKTVDEAKKAVSFDERYLCANGSEFEERFFSYYTIAKEGTDDDRKRLLKVIDLNISSHNCDSRKFAKILKAVCLKPKAFTPFSEIVSAKLKNNDALLAKNEAQQAYEKAKWNRLDRSALKFCATRLSEAKKASKQAEREYKKHLSPIALGWFTCQLEYLKDLMKVVNGYFAYIGTIYRVVLQSASFFAKRFVRVLSSLPKVTKDLDVGHVKALYEEDKKVEEELSKLENKSLPDLQKELQTRFKEEDIRLKAQKTAFVSQLSGVFKGKEKLHLMGQKEILEFDQLQHLFLEGAYGEILKKTALGEDETIRLVTSLTHYLMALSRNQRLERTLSLIKEHDKANTADKEECKRRVIEQLLEKRARDTTDFNKIERAQLSFECAQNLLYRQEQVEIIKGLMSALKGHKDVLLEMRTGAGKTNLLNPTLTATLGYEGHHVVSVCPAASEMVNTLGLEKQRQGSLGKGVERFSFSRNVELSEESLKFMCDELNRQLKEGIPLSVRPESIRSMELHYKLLLEKAKKANPVKREEIFKMVGYLQKMLSFFRSKSVAIVDEEHVNFDPNEHIVYTNGDKKPIENHHVDVVDDLFVGLKEMGSVNYRDNEQSLLKKEDYRNSVAPKLAKFFFDKYQVSAKLSQMSIDEDEFNKFVLEDIDKIPEWLTKLPEALREQIALVRGYLFFILEPTLKGSVNVSFGLSHLPNHLKDKPYAIVYSGSDTPKENEVSPSQFKVPEKTLVATYLTYLHRGLDESQFAEAIEFLQLEVDKAMTRNESIEEIEAYKLFQGLFASGEDVPDLLPLKEEDIKRLFKRLDGERNPFHKNEALIRFFVKNLVIPKLYIYDETLTSTVQNMRSQFKKEVGMSATPLDKNTHAPNTETILDEKNAERVTQFLKTKSKGIILLKEKKFEDVCEEIGDKISTNDNLMAFIDVAALFKGHKSQDVAEKLSEYLMDRDKVTGVVFFDDKTEQFFILDKKTKKVSAFDGSRDPNTYFVFFDQNRCYGSDIKMPMMAEALLFISDETTKGLAAQGMGRLRQIHKNQTFHYVLQEQVAENMGGDLREDKIVDQLINNQRTKEQQANFEAQKQQMDDMIHSALMETLLSLSPKKAMSYFSKMRSKFIVKEASDPVARYASRSKEDKAVTILKDYVKGKIKEVKDLKLSRSKKKELIKKLQAFEKTFEANKYPDLVRGSCDHSQQLEVQQHQEVKIDENVHQEIIPKSEYKIPWGHSISDIFSTGWEKPQRVSAIPLNTRIKSLYMKLKTAFFGVYKRGSSTLIGKSWYILKVTVVSLIALPILTTIFIVRLPYAIYTSYKIFKDRQKGIFKPSIDESPGSSRCPFYAAKDVLKKHLPSQFSQVSHFFDSNLLVTNNFWEMKTQRVMEDPHRLFTTDEKPLNAILVIQDKGQSPKAVLIDQNDSEFFRAKLLKNREDNKTGSSRKVGIYDLVNSCMVDQGADSFDDEFFKDPKFMSLVGQAKILGGYINYSKDELQAISSRFRGNTSVLKFMETKVLHNNRANKKSFSDTDLYKMLLGK